MTSNNVINTDDNLIKYTRISDGLNTKTSKSAPILSTFNNDNSREKKGIIKMTVDANHAFDLENIVYLMLLSKRYRIILSINDLSSDYSTCKRYMIEVEDQLELLSRFNIDICKIVKYSEYVAHATLYLGRLVKTKMRHIMCETDDIGGAQKTVFFNKIVGRTPVSVVVANRGVIKPELYDAITDDVFGAVYSYNVAKFSRAESFCVLKGLSSALNLRVSEPIKHLQNKSAISKCPVHLLSPACLEILTRIDDNLFGIDTVHKISDLPLLAEGIIDSVLQKVFDLDSFIINNCSVDNDSAKFLVDPVRITIDGMHNAIVAKRNVKFKSVIYVDKTVGEIQTESNIRLRYATTLHIKKDKDTGFLKGNFVSKKKIKTSYNWMSPSDNLIELICDAERIVIRDDMRNKVSDKIIDKIGVVQYKGAIYYTVKDSHDYNQIDNMEKSDVEIISWNLTHENYPSQNESIQNKEINVSRYNMYKCI